jgi:hypothetical protein
MKLKYNLDEIKDFAVAPGRHRARLVKVEQTLSQQGKPMLTWHWKIVSGPEKGSEIKSWTSLVENALSNLKNHLEAFGLSGQVNKDTSALIGKYVILVVGTRVGVNRSGDEQEFSNVMTVRPDGEVVAPKGKTSKKNRVVEEDGEDEDEDDEEVDDEDDEDEDEDGEDEDDEDEDEDEDDEEEEPPVKVKTKKSFIARKTSSATTSKKPLKKPIRHGREIPF